MTVYVSPWAEAVDTTWTNAVSLISLSLSLSHSLFLSLELRCRRVAFLASWTSWSRLPASSMTTVHTHNSVFDHEEDLLEALFYLLSPSLRYPAPLWWQSPERSLLCQPPVALLPHGWCGHSAREKPISEERYAMSKWPHLFIKTATPTSEVTTPTSMQEFRNIVHKIP